MALKISQAKVWAASMDDKPGALAEKLAALADVGANLECIFARSLNERPGSGIVFLMPLQGAKQIRAAEALGFECISRIFTVRVEAPDAPGLASTVARKVAAAGLNLRGFSASVHGKKGVIYLAFDSGADAAAGIRALKRK
jgi:hypothetical protein